jgi:hypothetical protein
MSSQQNSQGWQRGVNQYGNQYDHRGDGAARGGMLNIQDVENLHISSCSWMYYFIPNET